MENRAPTVAVQAVRSIPHDPGAFTQGLAFHDGFLYESTGRRGESSLRRVDPASGKVLQRVDVPTPYFAEGAAVLGGRIYQLTWQEQTGFIYDLATLARTGTFSYQGEGWGLTTDGRSLILSDGTSTLRFLDPASFGVVRTLEVTEGGRPVHLLNELEWVRGEIWANVWYEEEIARIDPRTGRVLGWLDLSALLPPVHDQNQEAVLNGIALDQKTGRIFVTGKLWPMLYEILVPTGVGTTGGSKTASNP